MTLSSPIVPLVIGGAKEALAISQELLRMGFHVPAIRPPTVPEGTSRLRMALSAAHSEQDVEDLVQALRRCGALQPSQIALRERAGGDGVTLLEATAASLSAHSVIQPAGNRPLLSKL
jgi:hypothetical protein